MAFPFRAALSAAALVTVTTLVVGCSSDDQPTAASSSPAAPASSSTSTTPPPPPCGTEQVAAMTLRQKLAQRLVVGITDAADARQAVQSEQIGGVFYGSWTDPSALADGAMTAVSKAGKTPLMVTVDQEGGRVARLSSFGVDMPSARSLVASGTTPEQARAQAKAAGEKMRALGVTTDFAPDADVSDEPDDEVIGDRSFSNDPKVVAEYAQAVAKGLEDAGVQPVFKHFPGHGHGSGDSHTGAVTTPPLDQLEKSDLVPYKTLLADPGNAAVMVGHLNVPGLTVGDTPASMSAKAIGMLRSGQPYGGPPFDGVVFTDDLSGMKAITDKYSIDQAVVRAFRAGADIALWQTTAQVPQVLDALEAAVKNGDLHEASVDRSVIRILKAKGVVKCG
ncbi:MAG: glycoside hydrolase family 3 N-terminal domain-containing protein [Gordonia sp. (in: high G+C Gram-positive bacteria)]|uniref:glycoside hydrolase family 3 N-terminal domain-containing protein n=1 Tax=Gordonia sp. (in: high G+C Gram-positive bacteria) TaxID=84139 RepID=UPI0039E607B1